MHRAMLGLISIAGVALGQNTSDSAETIRRIRENGRMYIQRLGLLTCTENTRQTVATGGVTWTESREDGCDTRQYKLFALQSMEVAGVPAHDRPRRSAKSDPDWRAQLMDASLAASAPLVGAIADPRISADMRSLRTEALQGRIVEVFSWQGAAPDGYPLIDRNGMRRVPYRGLYADPSSGAFVRLSVECFNIPRDSEYTAASLTLDFRPFEVDGRTVDLPSRSVVTFRTDFGSATNEAEYSAYRLANFSTDSGIQFGDEAAGEKEAGEKGR
jgi:hypothetical protein